GCGCPRSPAICTRSASPERSTPGPTAPSWPHFASSKRTPIGRRTQEHPMSKTVSKLAAFVFAHGEMAHQILFRDTEEDGEVPGLRPEEREAIDRAAPILRETWIDLLSACREQVWKLAEGHAAAEVLR